MMHQKRKQAPFKYLSLVMFIEWHFEMSFPEWHFHILMQLNL
jgi:hypothetical protein